MGIMVTFYSQMKYSTKNVKIKDKYWCLYILYSYRGGVRNPIKDVIRLGQADRFIVSYVVLASCGQYEKVRVESRMEQINVLVKRFRDAIDRAKAAGRFEKEVCFKDFPYCCCGDTSDLLGHYLLSHGICTNYVCGQHYTKDYGCDASHAWLMLENNMIIDITGDQFSGKPAFLSYSKKAYIGKMDAFHKLFVVEKYDVRKTVSLYDLGCLDPARLPRIYNIIMEYIE